LFRFCTFLVQLISNQFSFSRHLPKNLRTSSDVPCSWKSSNSESFDFLVQGFWK
jgi:hypothetical protein